MKKLMDGPGPSLLILFSTSEIPRPLTHLFSGEENLSKHKSHACHIMGLSFPFLSSLASQPACALIPIPIDSRQPEPEEARGGAVLELATRRPLSLSRLRSILHDCEDRTRSARDRIDQGARTTARAAVGSFSGGGGTTRRAAAPGGALVCSAPVVPARPEFAPCMYLVLQISSNEIIGSNLELTIAFLSPRDHWFSRMDRSILVRTQIHIIIIYFLSIPIR